MKKIINFIFLLLLCVTHLIAQEAPCPPNGISTDPSNPVNPQFPDSTMSAFDWTASSYTVYSSTITGNNIQSPFFKINNASTVSFVLDKDRLPKDGWELIKYDFGTPQFPTDYVYLVLYNKYTGILRVFVAGDTPTSKNGIRILISFDEPRTEYYSSALSSIYEPMPMDKFEKDSQGLSPKGLSVDRYLNGNGNWHYADFYIGYDPCTCFYTSMLFIDIKLIDTASITLTGSINGTMTNIDDNNSQSDPSWSFSDALNAGEKANKTFSSIDKWVTAQERALDIEGKTEAQLELEGLFDKLTKKKALNELQEAIKGSGFLKAGLKAAPYIGAAFELVSFFLGGGKKPDGPQEVKIMPMSIQADVKLNGTIEGIYPYKDISFSTPGSKDVINQDTILDFYPHYNEVLGVMNIMKTPKAYTTPLWDYFCVFGPCSPVPAGARYKLAEDIEFVLNPAAGFKPNPEIELAWRVEYASPDGFFHRNFQTPLTPASCFKDYAVNVPIFIYAPTTAQVFLKVFANLEREDADGNTQNVLWVSEYPVETISDVVSPTVVDWNSVGSTLATNLEFLSPNPRYILFSQSVWKNITIGVELIPSNSFQTYTLTAGGEIILEEGAVINPGINLVVDLPTACQSNLAPAPP